MTEVMARAAGLPKVPDRAWHGPVGAAVQAIAPSTEADPIAILVQVLALFGALCGISPYVEVGGVAHRARIWPLIVGRTSAGRKGTSLHEAQALSRRYSIYAERYMASRVVQGLSTGEGLLAALGAVPAGKDGEPPPEAIAEDGRLTVVETEFARVLAAAGRDQATLGQILRQLWESDHAGVMTRQQPLRVEGAHLVVIAHITPGELRIKLGQADLVGGTLNRFLVIGSERTQLLAHPMLRPDLAEWTRGLGEAAEDARGVRRVPLDKAARALWTDVYAALCDDEPDGHLGAVLARGPAYVQRLAMCYALADGCTSIAPDHLLAGLSVWHYSTESARQLFADGRRRDETERLVAYLQGAASRTGTEVYRECFGGNASHAVVKAILDRLVDRGDVHVEMVQTGGRPASRFSWIGAPADAVAELLDRWRFGPPG